MQKPTWWNCLKAGLVLALVSIFINFVLAFLGFAGLYAIMNGGVAITTVGIITVMIAVPLLFIVDGFIMYHIVKWAFKG